MDHPECTFSMFSNLLGHLLNGTDLGNFLPCHCSRMDIIPGMAVDTHCVLRPPWACHGDEAAQLRVLLVSILFILAPT